MVSKETPLISNLNMQENIALIKEANEFLSIDKAEKLARDYLHHIGIYKISTLRSKQCSAEQIFYTQFIRALMNETPTIVVIKPFLLMHNLNNINLVIPEIIKLCKFHETNNNKMGIKPLNASINIYIVDTLTNQYLYRDCQCPILK